jgi:hypothetical protein
MNNIMKEFTLKVTEDEFKIVKEALDYLPNRCRTPGLMQGLMQIMMRGDDSDETKAKVEENLKADYEKHEQEASEVAEITELLKAKLLLQTRL